MSSVDFKKWPCCIYLSLRFMSYVDFRNLQCCISLSPKYSHVFVVKIFPRPLSILGIGNVAYLCH